MTYLCTIVLFYTFCLITRLFEKRKRHISSAAVGFILDWTQTSTHHTRLLRNHIYASEIAHIDVNEKVLQLPTPHPISCRATTHRICGVFPGHYSNAPTIN